MALRAVDCWQTEQRIKTKRKQENENKIKEEKALKSHISDEFHG